MDTAIYADLLTEEALHVLPLAALRLVGVVLRVTHRVENYN